MTDQYPLDAWGIEGLDPVDHRWYLLENEVHGRREYAEQSRRNLNSGAWRDEELRIVPLTLTKRDRP